MLAAGRDEAKREIDERLKAGLPMTLAKPTFYAVGGGWRALAKAHMALTKAPVRVTHGYASSAAEAREFAKSIWRAAPAKAATIAGVQSRRARSLPSAAHRARPRAEAAGAGKGRVLGARPARGAALLEAVATRSATAIRWSRARG